MTRDKWITNQTINTTTACHMQWDRTFCILAAGINTRILTFFIHTRQIIATIRVCFALWSTIRWNTLIARQTCTRRTIIHRIAFCVPATGVRNTNIYRLISVRRRFNGCSIRWNWDNDEKLYYYYRLSKYSTKCNSNSISENWIIQFKKLML